MSKLNECHVYGIINKITINYDDNGKKPISAIFSVHTVRRKSGKIGAEESKGNDDLLFFTKEEDKLNTLMHIEKEVNNAKKNTSSLKYAIECYGSLVTRRLENTITCQGCKKEFNTNIYYAYIRPTVINLIGEPLRPAQQVSFLKRMREKSNSISLIGNVASEIFIMNEMEKNISNEEEVFSLVVKRNYPVIEDSMNNVDFPLVSANVLEDERNYIKKDSSILIRGSVWLKKIKRIDTCPYCGYEHKYDDEITLIFPYNVEFLFSSKNRYAFGAAVKSFNDEVKIYITINDSPFCTIKSVSALSNDEYSNVRKNLYPRVIKRIQPIAENELIIDLEDEKILNLAGEGNEG